MKRQGTKKLGWGIWLAGAATAAYFGGAYEVIMEGLPAFVPVYADRLIRWAVTPVLGIMYRHIGEPSPLIHLLRDPVYYVDLGVCVLSMWLIWGLIKGIIGRLDRHYSWIEAFYQRLVVQALAVYGTAVLVVVLITFVYNDIVMKDYRHEVYDINFSFVVDVPVTLLIVTIQQLIYFALYQRAFYEDMLAQSASAALLPATEPRPATPKNVLVDFGKSLLPIALEEIAYFHKIGEVTLVRTFEGKDYRLDQTLEQLESGLAADRFYRLNRQMIANVESVKEVKADAGGKLAVTLAPAYEGGVTVSRKKSADFKVWLKG